MIDLERVARSSCLASGQCACATLAECSDFVLDLPVARAAALDVIEQLCRSADISSDRATWCFLLAAKSELERDRP